MLIKFEMQTKVTITSIFDNYETFQKNLILKRITSSIPNYSFNGAHLNIPR